MIPTYDMYPVFEANQVLLSDHLNRLFGYLDENERLTRAALIGVGIASGLQCSVQSAPAAVRLTKGCGITTDGYLLLHPEDVSYTAIRPYTLPDEPAYLPFRAGGTASGDQVPLWELVTAVDASSTSLADTPALLQQKALLLFLELKQESLRTCAPGDCTERGSRITATLRPLLIGTADAAALQRVMDASGTSGLEAGVAERTAPAVLPQLRLRRLDVPNSGMDTADEIVNAYRALLLAPQPASGSGSVFEHVGKALSHAYTAYRPLLADLAPADPFADHLAALRARYMSTLTGSAVMFSQYWYDALNDLARAYEEFRGAASALRTLCCPAGVSFPRHLMIGELPALGPAGMQLYRHDFRPSPAQAAHAALRDQARMLFERLVLMVRHLDIPQSTARLQPLRVTPCGGGAQPLSESAIPYYYAAAQGRPALYERWNPRAASAGRARDTRGYHAAQYSAPAEIRTPLEYIHDECAFYRVEGHVGRPWRTVLEDMLELIASHRLPFDVVALNADNLPVDRNPWSGRCISNDLEVIYRAWAGEVECLLKERIAAISGRPVKIPGRTGAVAAPSTPAAPAGTGGSRPASGTGRTAGSDVVEPLLKRSNAAVEAARRDVASRMPNLEKIIPAITVQEGTLGGIVGSLLAEGGQTATTSEAVRETLRKDAAVGALTMDQYDALIGRNVELLGALVNAGSALDNDLASVDIDELDRRFDAVAQVSGAYLDWITAYVPSGDADVITQKDKDEIIAELRKLLATCLRDKLRIVKAELDARTQAVEELVSFSRFVKKHPEIEHRGGVPRGGTLVLVFRESRTPAAPAIRRPGRVTIPEGVVFADFFLPVRCCSDCPPVQFVLPPRPPSFLATMSCTLVDDTGAAMADVSIRAAGGTAPYRCVVDDGTPSEPFEVDTTLKLAGGRDHRILVVDSEGLHSSEQTLHVPDPLRVTTTSLPGWPVGEAVSHQFTASGGTGDRLWSLADGQVLPEGWLLSPAGVLTGRSDVPVSFPCAVRVTDERKCTASSDVLTVAIVAKNEEPWIETRRVSGRQGSPAASVVIATVGDADEAAPGLAVTVTPAERNGVSISGVTVSDDGSVHASVLASCTARDAQFTVTVSDSQRVSVSAELQVVVLPNTPPVLSYGAHSVAAGGTATIRPQQGPADNGTITSIVLREPGTYTGGISVDAATGVITLMRARPGGVHALVIRATDQCGAFTDASIALTVTCPVITLAPASLPEGNTGMPYKQLTLSARGGTAPYTFAVAKGALPEGIVLSPSGDLAGTPLKPGTFTATITATDANGCVGDASYTIVIGRQGPVITGLTPAAGPVKTVVTIQGSGLAETASVLFHKEVQTRIRSKSDTEVVVIVPDGAVTGPLTISIPGSEVLRTAPFTVTTGPGREPVIPVPLRPTGAGGAARGRTGAASTGTAARGKKTPPAAAPGKTPPSKRTKSSASAGTSARSGTSAPAPAKKKKKPGTSARGTRRKGGT